MGLVVLEFEVLEGERVDVVDGRVDGHGRERPRGTGELQTGLLEMVRVEVQVPEGVNKVTGLISENLGNHEGEQRVARNVERDPKKQVRAPLVELAGKSGPWGSRVVHVELKEKVAGGKGHLANLGDVPCRNNVAAGMGLVPEGGDETRDLVDRVAVGAFPSPPLLAVHRAKLSILIGPIIPDANPVLLEIGNVGVAFEKPKKFVDDRAEMELFCGEAGKSVTEIEADLMAEHREGSRAGPVGAFLPVVEDVLENVKILPHDGDSSGERAAGSKGRIRPVAPRNPKRFPVAPKSRQSRHQTHRSAADPPLVYVYGCRVG